MKPFPRELNMYEYGDPYFLSNGHCWRKLKIRETESHQYGIRIWWQSDYQCTVCNAYYPQGLSCDEIVIRDVIE